MDCVTDQVSRVLSELSVLVRGGHVRPITPRRDFGYNEVPAALQLLRTGSQIGKVVISNGPDTRIIVPVNIESLSTNMAF